jgi:cell wall-associated NlpC family hydrolase
VKEGAYDMRKAMRHSMVAVLTLALAVTAACTDQGNKSGQNQEGQNTSPSPTVQANQQNQGGGIFTAQAGGEAARLQTTEMDGSLPIRNQGGDEYVQITKLTELVGFKSVWDSNMKVLKFGDNDAAFEIQMDSTKARREEDPMTFSKAPVMIDGIPHVPVTGITDLLSDEVSFTRQGNLLIVTPTADPVDLTVDQDGDLPQGAEMNFGEDPDDPYKNMPEGDENAAPTSAQNEGDEDGAVTAAALRNINIPGLITRAKTYLGVRYDFGASPYPQSGRFDCSSYTQYLFGKYGITLPRTARSQAKLGNSVSRTSLRRGDLLYFYVPGRFKTNKTVGHVGIYIGNNRMIHSSPLPKDGVQYTDINKAYWKRTFMYAKRIAY